MGYNTKKFNFPDLDIDLDIEIQTLPVRIYKHGSNIQIGTALIVGAGVGQGVVKLLYIDSEYRLTHLKNAHTSLIAAGSSFGFIERIFQRKKLDGTFLTFIKKILMRQL